MEDFPKVAIDVPRFLAREGFNAAYNRIFRCAVSFDYAGQCVEFENLVIIKTVTYQTLSSTCQCQKLLTVWIELLINLLF